MPHIRIASSQEQPNNFQRQLDIQLKRLEVQEEEHGCSRKSTIATNLDTTHVPAPVIFHPSVFSSQSR